MTGFKPRTSGVGSDRVMLSTLINLQIPKILLKCTEKTTTKILLYFARFTNVFFSSFWLILNTFAPRICLLICLVQTRSPPSPAATTTTTMTTATTTLSRSAFVDSDKGSSTSFSLSLTHTESILKDSSHTHTKIMRVWFPRNGEGCASDCCKKSQNMTDIYDLWKYSLFERLGFIGSAELVRSRHELPRAAKRLAASFHLSSYNQCDQMLE